MKARRHADPGSFLERARPWLLRAEVEHNLILGICGGLDATPPDGAEPPYLATVEDDGQVVACGFRALPHKAIITRGDPAAIDCLVQDLGDRYPDLHMVLGPEPEVQRFAEQWSRRYGTTSRRGTAQRLFSIHRVDHPTRKPTGGLRPALEADVPTLVSWIDAFTAEAGGIGVADPLQFAREHVGDGSLYVWDDARPVSMAACMGRTKTGIRITLVFTPPELRGRGYATTCVANLTQRMLDQGLAYCCLFTDLSNPTSNSIYQAIGYRPVLDMTDYFLNDRE